MPRLLVITHPEVAIDPGIPIPDWGLNDTGRRRVALFAASETFAGVTHIWSSAEKKARETAAILAAERRVPVQIDSRLGENDRSSTGFLARPEFEASADAFFCQPELSFRGWERAIDAQSRIHSAVCEIAKRHAGGDLAIVTHGAVGTLLFCRLRGVPISRKHDQPAQGHFWSADLATLRPETGWCPIA